MHKITDSLVEKQRSQQKSDLRFLIAIAILTGIFTIILILAKFVYMGVIVDGQSMTPTLNHEDVVVVNRLKRIEKNSIVIIEGKRDYLLIKRVVAVEGDEVEFNQDGFVYINGQKYQDEFGFADYSNRVDKPFTKKVLQEGEYFFLGDNRSASSDGRDLGSCSEEQIVGVVVEWSISSPIGKMLFFNAQKSL